MKWIKSILLGIWKMLARLFGNRKMEIDDIINKWFEQTFEKFQKEVRSSTETDRLLAGVLFASRKYVRAVLSLLSQKHALPAKALLRCQCELFMNTFWCLNVKGDTEEIKQAINENFERWDYSRLKADKKLFADMEKYASGDFLRDVQLSLKKLESDVDEYKRLGIRSMPSVACLYAELPRDHDKEDVKRVYAKIYRPYSRAIHLDRNTFSRLVRHEGDGIACYDDWDDDIHNLYADCLCMVCDINILIRDHYNWPTEELRHEHGALASKYDG